VKNGFSAQQAKGSFLPVSGHLKFVWEKPRGRMNPGRGTAGPSAG
jgi:hypothetical protein